MDKRTMPDDTRRMAWEHLRELHKVVLNAKAAVTANDRDWLESEARRIAGLAEAIQKGLA